MELIQEILGGCLFYWLIYIVYFLCFLIVMIVVLFILFYSMQWGKEIFNKWFLFMFVLFFQDVFIMQFLKIFFVVFVILLILKKLFSDFIEGLFVGRKISIVDFKLIVFDREEVIKRLFFMFKFLDEILVEKVRKYKLNELKVFRILRENILYLLFLLLLLVISYFMRDLDVFIQSRYLRYVFGEQVWCINVKLLVRIRMMKKGFKKVVYNEIVCLCLV